MKPQEVVWRKTAPFLREKIQKKERGSNARRTIAASDQGDGEKGKKGSEIGGGRVGGGKEIQGSKRSRNNVLGRIVKKDQGKGRHGPAGKETGSRILGPGGKESKGGPGREKET